MNKNKTIYSVKHDGLNLWLVSLLPLRYDSNINQAIVFPKIIAKMLCYFLNKKYPTIPVHVNTSVRLKTQIDGDWKIKGV